VGFNLVGIHIDHRTEALVRDRAVVTLEKVVDDVLPVRLDVVAESVGEREIGDIGRPARDFDGEVTGLFGQGRCGPVEVDVDEAAELGDKLEDVERTTIMKALEETRFNKTAAAKKLGLTLRALRYRIQKLDIE